jgi:hypothetical protein
MAGFALMCLFMGMIGWLGLSNMSLMNSNTENI